jgi:hypothetical protein
VSSTSSTTNPARSCCHRSSWQSSAISAPRHDLAAELAVLRELGGAAYLHASFNETDLATATDVIAEYGDQAIGIADASGVVIAARFETPRVFTLDHRHFDVLRTRDGKPLAVLPDR